MLREIATSPSYRPRNLEARILKVETADTRSGRPPSH
jgi:hypothetical protein